MNKSAILVLLLLLLPINLWAEILIIQSSDNHSKYKRVENFLFSTDKIIKDFKVSYPDGEVVFIFNGDFSGASSFANFNGDRGQLGLEAMATLAQEHTVLFTLGNHEAFDWIADGDVNNLLHFQLKYLKDNGVINLISNMTFKRRTQHLVTPFYDLSTTSGHKVRFYGLGLESFHDKVRSVNGHTADEVMGVDSYKEAMNLAFVNAKEDNINSLVLAFHDGFEKVQKATRRLHESLPNGLRLPLSFAAHDHLVGSTQVNGSHIIDSGSNFDFSAVVLDDDGTVSSHKFYNKESQIEIAQKPHTLPAKLRKVITKINDHMNELIRMRNGPLNEIPVIDESKLTLKKRRSYILGNSLGDSLVKLGEEYKTSKQDIPDHRVIGMFNSSSYRNDSIIDSGSLDEAEIKEMSPIKNNVKVLKMTGEEVLIFYKSLRRFRAEEGIYSPQISSNLKESLEKSLLIHGGVNQWQSFKKSEYYYVVLDNWLAINGYSIPEHDSLNLSAKVVHSSDQFETLKNYLYQSLINNLAKERSCKTLVRTFLDAI